MNGPTGNTTHDRPLTLTKSNKLDPRDLLNANHTDGQQHIKAEVGTEVHYLYLGTTGYYRTTDGEYVATEKVSQLYAAARYDELPSEVADR